MHDAGRRLLGPVVRRDDLTFPVEPTADGWRSHCGRYYVARTDAGYHAEAIGVAVLRPKGRWDYDSLQAALHACKLYHQRVTGNAVTVNTSHVVAWAAQHSGGAVCDAAPPQPRGSMKIALAKAHQMLSVLGFKIDDWEKADYQRRINSVVEGAYPKQDMLEQVQDDPEAKATLEAVLNAIDAKEEVTVVDRDKDADTVAAPAKKKSLAAAIAASEDNGDNDDDDAGQAAADAAAEANDADAPDDGADEETENAMTVAEPKRKPGRPAKASTNGRGPGRPPKAAAVAVSEPKRKPGRPAKNAPKPLKVRVAAATDEERGPTRTYTAGVVIRRHGTKGSVTDEMVNELDREFGVTNERESRFALRNALNAIRGYNAGK